MSVHSQNETTKEVCSLEVGNRALRISGVRSEHLGSGLIPLLPGHEAVEALVVEQGLKPRASPNAPGQTVDEVHCAPRNPRMMIPL